MGWNEGYTIMEHFVVTQYDNGGLTRDELNSIMLPFCNTDIDSGGSRNLKAKDGKKVEDIICFIIEPERYREATENFIPDPEEPDWNEDVYNLYREIIKREWGIW